MLLLNYFTNYSEEVFGNTEHNVTKSGIYC